MLDILINVMLQIVLPLLQDWINDQLFPILGVPLGDIVISVLLAIAILRKFLVRIKIINFYIWLINIKPLRKRLIKLKLFLDQYLHS